MSKKIFALISLVLIATMVLTACGGGQQAAPTQPPAAAPTEAAAAPVTLTIWHSYHTGGNEEKAVNQILDAYRAANPNVTVDVLEIPFDQLFNKWETEVAAGGGPDMYTAPNDSLGKEVRASLVAPLDDLLAGKLTNYTDVSIGGVTVDGKLYAVPGIIKAVALYYNKSTVPTPPKNTDELLQMVKDGKKLVLNQNPYHNFGFFGAFGGKLADDTGKCIADQGGFAEAMQYLVDLKAAGADFETDGAKADSLFRQGQADMIINGPWVLGDYTGDLGDKLGVAPMPAGPKGPAAPLTGIDGWYVNPNSKNKEAAVALALYITNADGQKLYADLAGDPAVYKGVETTDPNVKAFSTAADTGYLRPQSAWLDNFWGPFGDMVTKVMEGKSSPADGVKEACGAMNKANGK